MNFSKIGKFIAECRKEKNMTQEQLGLLLNVDRRTISKWENGVYAPDIALLEPLSSILNISVNELLNGEKVKNKKDSKNLIDVIKYYNDRYKSKVKKCSFIFISIIFIMFILYIIVNNFFSYKVSNLYSTNDYYNVNCVIVHNNFDEIIFMSDINYNDVYTGSDLEKKVTRIKASLYSETELIISQEYYYDKSKYFNDALNDIQLSYTKLRKVNSKDYYILVEYALENREALIDKIVFTDRSSN